MSKGIRYVVKVQNCISCGYHEYRVKTEAKADDLIQTLKDLRDVGCTAVYSVDIEDDPEAQ